MANAEKRLVSNFILFLQQQLEGNSQAEGLEVAIQCLQTVFGITPEDLTTLRSPTSLLELFSNDQQSVPSEADKQKAEQLKNEGNELMKNNKFHEAIHKYDEAIGLYKHAVFYCNRAAAYSKMDRHDAAIEDCKKSLQLDPSYSKAYGRMGVAYSCLNKHLEARDCYKRALELEPGNESFKKNLEIAEAKLAETNAAPQMPGGLGGFGGFDLASMLNNPALMNMATQLMTDPNMQNMMASMANAFQQAPGGGAAGGAGGAGGIGNLLNVGQRIAEQMQQQNPELVEQLRRQFQQNNPPGGGGQNPPGPGGGNDKDRPAPGSA